MSTRRRADAHGTGTSRGSLIAPVSDGLAWRVRRDARRESRKHPTTPHRRGGHGAAPTIHASVAAGREPPAGSRASSACAVRGITAQPEELRLPSKTGSLVRPVAERRQRALFGRRREPPRSAARTAHVVGTRHGCHGTPCSTPRAPHVFSARSSADGGAATGSRPCIHVSNPDRSVRTVIERPAIPLPAGLAASDA